MTKPARIAIFFYAVALLAWGFQQFALGYPVAGKPPVSADHAISIPFAYLSGVILIVCSLSILANYKAQAGAAIAGIGILIWSALPNIYFVVTNLDYGAMLTNMNKALTMGFGGLLVARSLNNGQNNSFLDKCIEVMAPLSVYFIGLFLFLSGIQHFLFVDFVKFLVPEWIPGNEAITYFSGGALIAAGVGMITGIKRQLACYLAGGMIFIWVFTLHLPRAMGAAGNANEWTAVFEALATSGLLALCGMTLSKKALGQEPMAAQSTF